jgi:hypothetical protein
MLAQVEQGAPPYFSCARLGRWRLNRHGITGMVRRATRRAGVV